MYPFKVYCVECSFPFAAGCGFVVSMLFLGLVDGFKCDILV